MKRKSWLLLGLFFMVCRTMAAEWQWSVSIPGVISQETGGHPRAFLYIPEDCRQVKAVMVGNHNMCEETLFENKGLSPCHPRDGTGFGVGRTRMGPGMESG